MSPKLAGIKERKHRPLLTCALCGEVPHRVCHRCRSYFCDKHLKEHDCVEVLLRSIEKYRDWLEETTDEIDERSNALFKTLDRLKKIVIYHDRPEVQRVLKVWGEGVKGEIDWLEPPAEVDVTLKELP